MSGSLRLKIGTALLTMALAMYTAAARPPDGKGGGGGGGGGGEEPPADPTIVYTHVRSNEAHLMVMNDDGSNATVVLENAGPSGLSFMLEPNWSPDGSRIVFHSDLFSVAGIYAIDLDGSGLELLATADHPMAPVWSPAPAPDGSYKILFADSTDGGSGPTDLFLVNPDGSGRQNLTGTPDVEEGYASWGPDGSSIVAIASGGDPWRSDLYRHELGLGLSGVEIVGTANLTDIEGSPLQRTFSLAFPDVSRYGDRVAVSAILEGESRFDLWIVDLFDPLVPYRVTSTPDIEERQPSWAPDDSELLFWGWGGRRDSGIFVIRPDGSGRSFVGDSKGKAPDWLR